VFMLSQFTGIATCTSVPELQTAPTLQYYKQLRYCCHSKNHATLQYYKQLRYCCHSKNHATLQYYKQLRYCCHSKNHAVW